MGAIFETLRKEMIVYQLLKRGIHDPAVLRAMETVGRELFVPHHLMNHAYEDGPLPIGEGQTISQPYVVAYMLQEARIQFRSRVLEIGTGSGYVAAVLSLLAEEVYSVERIHTLAITAQANLKKVKAKNVHLRQGDGSIG